MPITYTPLPDNVDHSKQSVTVPGTKQPGQTPFYGLLDPDSPNYPKTLQDIFNNGYSFNPDAKLLGHRPVISRSPLKFGPYSTVRRRRIGSALHRLFATGELKAADMETVGIWSRNRPEWQLVEFALHAYGKVGVSLYDTLGKESLTVLDSINHAQLPIIFTTPDHIAPLLKLAASISSVKVIVSFDPLGDDVRTIAFLLGGNFLHIDCSFAVEKYGEENLTEPLPVSPDQVVSLCYTSGTTNLPKGAILTHMNLASGAYANTFGTSFPLGCCLMSYLPLAHIYERICELTVITVGGCIGYSTGDPLRLMDDAQALKPHFFPSVPRVLNRVYQAAMSAGNVPGVKGAIFRTAVQTKLDQLYKTGVTAHVIWDALVFRKIRAVLGGNVLLMVTGSAPISGEVVDFLKIAFGCGVTEENCGVCTRTSQGDPTGGGTIGPPQPILEVKLVDLPAMNYLSNDKPNPRGELCVRGPNCFMGYYKDEKKTQETLRDGWIHTGDVAEVDSSGRFKIIDRVKNIMKLAQGEYVALEKVENTYAACPIVQQIYVHGDSLQPYLIAVVVPDPLVLAPLASAALGKKVEPGDTPALTEAVKNPQVIQEVLSSLNAGARKSGLAGFEFIKRIHVTMDPFTIEENTLTPTLKLRRRDAYAKFKRELDALYALGEPANNVSSRL
ncbi:long-chain-fatty-acid-CoA ligase [Pisolithus orientalis]|uniref:long-chain-fatty-acid-CoA ligase n=1 Tax=Pisolithus orientalis TaxID=936130 RepID=UPI0022241B25|nr:long-chain-fatty-acid-CoA ligase [Pisolithus orientalis]KAI6019689.1 long-chain-fatty-acid-CoA ligase [Pisolithus orientalis]